MFVRVYHTSFRNKREDILQYGLLPCGYGDNRSRWNFQYARGVYVSLDADDISARAFVAFENVDIWGFVVLRKRLKKDVYSSSDRHFYIERPVPPPALRLIKEVPYYRHGFVNELVKHYGITFLDLTNGEEG